MYVKNDKNDKRFSLICWSLKCIFSEHLFFFLFKRGSFWHISTFRWISRKESYLVICFGNWENTINGALKFQEKNGRNLPLHLEKRKKQQHSKHRKRKYSEKHLIWTYTVMHKILSKKYVLMRTGFCRARKFRSHCIKNEVFHKDFFSKYDQIKSNWSHFLKKSLWKTSFFMQCRM